MDVEKLREILEKINNHIDELDGLRDIFNENKKYASKERKLKDQLHLRSIKRLIKEAYMMGASASPCPRCGGTGRV